MLELALDPTWTGVLPVWSWVIEHPEGLLVVDAGETAHAFRDPQHFDPVNRLIFRNFFRFSEVNPLAQQMRQAGLDPLEVRWVVQTHLHFDHADGLVDFPRAEVLLSRTELEFHRATPQGSALQSWYVEDRIRPLETSGGRPWETFEGAHPLTRAGDIWLVPTPGHTPGHLSVAIERGPDLTFLAGDTSFTDEQLGGGPLPGISWDLRVLRGSLERIRSLCGKRPVIYLPSHDHDSPRRLAEGVCTQTSSSTASRELSITSR